MLSRTNLKCNVMKPKGPRWAITSWCLAACAQCTAHNAQCTMHFFLLELHMTDAPWQRNRSRLGLDHNITYDVQGADEGRGRTMTSWMERTSLPGTVKLVSFSTGPLKTSTSKRCTFLYVATICPAEFTITWQFCRRWGSVLQYS